VEEILAILEDDRIYFDESRGGVTFSGGEPFAQPHFLRDLLYACEEREIPVVLDTCGHVAPDTFRDLAPLARHLLFDLKLMDRERHEAFTGVGNHWILENLSWVANGCKRVASSPGNEGELETAGEVMAGGGAGGGARGHSWSCPSLTVRVPLIPGVNDDSENLSATAEFLTGLTRVPPVDLLPYHRLGVEKYHRTGRPYSLSGVFPPTRDVVGRAVQLLEGAGLTVTVRGERYDHD